MRGPSCWGPGCIAPAIVTAMVPRLVFLLLILFFSRFLTESYVFFIKLMFCRKKTVQDIIVKIIKIEIALKLKKLINCIEVFFETS